MWFKTNSSTKTCISMLPSDKNFVVVSSVKKKQKKNPSTAFLSFTEVDL